MTPRTLIVACVVISLFTSAARAQTVGATTPFVTYEAENYAQQGGAIVGSAAVVSLTIPRTTKVSAPELEASGHSYVSLKTTGDSVSWKNNTGNSITALNLRYSIPDAPTGGGISSTLDLYVNGTLRGAINVNSIQTWTYDTTSDYDGKDQNPADGTPHVFWDETHFFVPGGAIPNGATITLQKDTTNNASYYNIDCIDLETPPAPLAQPANSLSITSYGASTTSADNTAAIQACINAAQTQSKSVWIPQGTFNITTPGLTATGITIQGAGMWYSIIYANVPLPSGTVRDVIYPTSCTLQNFAINSNARSPGTGDGNGGGINVKGSNWLVDGLWIEHEGAAVWADGTNGIVRNCRIDSAWADGININNGNGATGNNIGNNLTVTNNFVRGSGDDSIAINSGASTGVSPGCQQMQNAKVINNTTVAPWWANCYGVYGGAYDVVQNNLGTDSVKDYGMLVGVFSTFMPMDSALIQNNIILRGGSYGYGAARAAVHIGTVNEPNSVNSLNFSNNLISNTMYDGIHIYRNTGDIVVQDNVVARPGTTGVLIDSVASGKAMIYDNIVSSLGTGQAAFLNNSTSLVLTESPGTETAAPIAGSVYSTDVGGIGTQSCSEGGLNLDGITAGSYTGYNSVNLTGATTFVIRQACWNTAGSTVQIYLDNPTTGTLIGTCALPYTGSTQTWATATCNLSSATGTHNVYLVNTSGHDHNIEWFGLLGRGTVTAASSYTSNVGGIGTQTCSEGGLNIDGITAGSYTGYANLNLDGTTAFCVRESCWNTTGTTLQVYLDSPTGTPLTTVTLPYTGGTQNWTTVSCVLNGVSGVHTVYLVNTSGHDHNIEWFAFPGSGH